MMADLAEEFNFQATDSFKPAFKREAAKQPDTGKSILQDMEADRTRQAAELRVEQQRARSVEITSITNAIIGPRQPTPGKHEIPQVDQQKVDFMLKRAKQENLTLDQLTPRDIQEVYIRRGYLKRMDIEKSELKQFSKDTDRMLAKALHGMGGPDLTPLLDRAEKGRSLSDQFNTRGRDRDR